MCVYVCVYVCVKTEFQAGRDKKRKEEAGKVVGNVLSLYTPCIRQRQVKKGRGRQRQER